MKRAAPKGGGKKKAYDRPEVFSAGEILTDNCNKRWKLGKSIGAGGFGDIYLASDEVTKAVSEKTAQHVVKIEPHANGPLFVEINFYLRAAKTEMIEEWKQQRKIDTLGMPAYVSSGSHEYKSTKYRFMVIPRFGQDLHKIIETKPGRRLSCRSVQAVSLQIIDILEYIHSRDFIHGDIKASNLLLGLGKKQQLYLLDYGLAARYKTPAGEHLKYGPDARKAHNGTLEYTARDAHIGAFSCRGDLEILGYNLLEWLTGKLPWNSTDAPDVIAKQKNLFMTNVSLKKLYPADIPGLDLVEKYLRYVAGLAFEEKPNYSLCREILRKGLPAKLTTLYLEDSFAPPQKKKVSTSRKRSPAASKVSSEPSFEDEVDLSPPKKIKLPESAGAAKRSTRTTKRVQKNFDWTRVLSSNPEKIIHQTNGAQTPETKLKKAPLPGNLTPAMIQILSKRKENSPLATPAPRAPTRTDLVEGTTKLTPAMKEILLKTKKKKLRKSLGGEEGRILLAKKIKQKAVATAAGRANSVGGAVVGGTSHQESTRANSSMAAITSRSARHLRRNPL